MIVFFVRCTRTVPLSCLLCPHLHPVVLLILFLWNPHIRLESILAVRLQFSDNVEDKSNVFERKLLFRCQYVVDLLRFMAPVAVASEDVVGLEVFVSEGFLWR